MKHYFFALTCLFSTIKAEAPGLALAGGGALGFAHIGVLRVLEENRIPVSAIGGTSMGAIVGAAYASGASLEQIDEILSNTDWNELFVDGPERSELPLLAKAHSEILGEGRFGVRDGSVVFPTGLLEGQKIRPVLQRLYSRYPKDLDFDRLPIRFRAVAADLETGKEVILKRGELATAARASMAVPGVFSPVEKDGRLLVDGGIANNLPIDVVRGLGAKELIVVELNAELKKKEELTNPLSISGQIISLLLAQNAALQKKTLTDRDVLIEPDLKGFSSTDFDKADEIIKRGEQAARKMITALRRFSVPEQEYQMFKNRLEEHDGFDKEPKFVEIENDSVLPDAILAREIYGDVDSSIERIFSLGAFSQVSSEFIERDGESGLKIIAKEKKSWAQHLRVGLSLEDGFRGDSFYNLGVGLRVFDEGYWDAMMRLGRVSSLALENRRLIDNDWFYGFDGYIGRRGLFFEDKGDIVAEYERKLALAGLKLGYGFYKTWESSIGFKAGSGEVERKVGSPTLPDLDYDVADLILGFEHDTLDDPDFPKKGLFLQGRVIHSSDSLGSESEFTEFKGKVRKPFSLGADTVEYKGEVSQSHGERPIGRSYTVGGFLDFSGRLESSLVTSEYIINQFNYYHQLGSSKSLFGYELFLGGSLELGWFRSDVETIPDYSSLFAGSLFLGVNTPVLPAYFGFGLSEGGDRAVYFMLGRLSASSQRDDGGL